MNKYWYTFFFIILSIFLVSCQGNNGIFPTIPINTATLQYTPTEDDKPSLTPTTKSTPQFSPTEDVTPSPTPINIFESDSIYISTERGETIVFNYESGESYLIKLPGRCVIMPGYNAPFANLKIIYFSMNWAAQK